MILWQPRPGINHDPVAAAAGWRRRRGAMRNGRRGWVAARRLAAEGSLASGSIASGAVIQWDANQRHADRRPGRSLHADSGLGSRAGNGAPDSERSCRLDAAQRFQGMAGGQRSATVVGRGDCELLTELPCCCPGCCQVCSGSINCAQPLGIARHERARLHILRSDLRICDEL